MASTITERRTAIVEAPAATEEKIEWADNVLGVRESFTFERQPQAKYFRSRRIQGRKVDMPWLKNKSQHDPFGNWLPKLGFVLGLAVATVIVWNQVRYIMNPNYCPVLMDDFSNGFNSESWTKEVECGGFGNGEFEVTTNTEENVFVRDGQLWIKPTLQDAQYIENNYTMNLLKDGSCTGSSWAECVAVTNLNNGSIVPPVKSGRIHTTKSIRYGRVEVEAKIPAGDWLWPAIWMLPTDNVYGVWPRSGEIDIMESRGNDRSYPMGGRNIVSSSLHWGPSSDQDGWWRNFNKRHSLHAGFSDDFHTYGLEWTEKYIFTYIDTRLFQVIYLRFNEPFWTRGAFASYGNDASTLVNPWGQTGADQTPFDQDFHLVLNVAVGGTNGWFGDGLAGKPWVDNSNVARGEFWAARDTWYPTWEESGQMIVRSVKMYQQQGHKGCENGYQVWPSKEDAVRNG